MMEIKYCKRCLMPSSRPRIVFDDNGICNACRYADKKKTIDWEARKKEFLEFIEPYRSKDGGWDCIVPWSGGKDSSTIAYKLKFEFGMNPLLVTFSPQLPTDIGNHNREEMIKLGFDHIFFRPNQKIHRHLARRFFIERGNQKVAWDAGINTIPVKVALKFGIKLMFYAEHGESEYGGKLLSPEHEKMRDFAEVMEHQIGDDPSNWTDDVVDIKDLNPYIYPSREEIKKAGIKVMYFGYFFKWSMFDNYNFIKEKIDFQRVYRTSGTFTNFDSLDDKSDDLYYYMQYIKFGFGRCVRDASRMIQNGDITREDGLDYCKMYDGEHPLKSTALSKEYFNDMLEYLNLTRDEFDNIVDKHRNNEIWENGKIKYNIR